MKKYPNVAIKLILRFKNKVLILKQPNGKFSFPGGRVEWKESPMEALKRELREEITYNLMAKPALSHIYNYISSNGNRHTIIIDYYLKLNKKPEIYPREKLKILWLTKKEMTSLNIIKDKDFLDKILK